MTLLRRYDPRRVHYAVPLTGFKFGLAFNRALPIPFTVGVPGAAVNRGSPLLLAANGEGSEAVVR